MTFDSEQISELLKSDNLHFRKIAFKTIVDNFERYAGMFFDIIANETGYDDLLQNASQRFPALNEGFEKPNPFFPKKNYQYFAECADEYALFINKCQEYCSKEVDEKKREELINRLSISFSGLSADLSRLFPQYHVLNKSEGVVDKQLMIFITGKCNLNCPYCFSAELQPQEMSLTDFDGILQWAKRNQVTKISLCGGEPTIHSHFDKILQLIENHGFKTYFASNFTFDCTSLENFNSNVIDQVFIHLTGQTFENQHLMDQLHKNVEYAKKAKIELMCRTNIANENPPVTAWFHFLEETKIQNLNIALTFPTPKADNQFIDIRSFEQYHSIIEQIINKATERRVGVTFAKPIPLCIFDGTMIRYLFALQKLRPLCNIYEENYTRNLCITLKKEFHACLGVTSSSLKFRENMEWSEVENFCANVIRPLLSKPLWTKCNDCFLFDRKLCQGACLSYKTVL